MAPAFNLEDMFREEILTRLPIKSLIRCRCVCKLWNSLFFDPYFTRTHFNRSISRNPDNDDYLILINTYKGTSPCVLSILSRTNLPETRIDKVPYPLSSQVDYICLVGSINGLVCIAYLSDQDYYFVLWNPATHQSRTILLQRQCPLQKYHIAYMFGFGWDSVTDDYKLIANSSHYSSLPAIVYSYKTGSWSKTVNNVNNLFPLEIGNCCYPRVVVKGIPYWNLYQSRVVIKFDVRTNEFSLLETAPYVREYFSLINMNDCLALREYIYGSNSSQMYRFNEEGNIWTKMHTVIPCKKSERTTTRKYGGEILYNGQNNLYDPKSNEIRSLAYGKERGYSVHGFSYTPSLLALKGMETIHS